MKDINNNRLLNCKPEDTGCFFNEDTYYWNHDEPKCKYYELKKVRGIFTFVDGVRYTKWGLKRLHDNSARMYGTNICHSPCWGRTCSIGWNADRWNVT